MAWPSSPQRINRRRVSCSISGTPTIVSARFQLFRSIEPRTPTENAAILTVHPKGSARSSLSYNCRYFSSFDSSASLKDCRLPSIGLVNSSITKPRRLQSIKTPSGFCRVTFCLMRGCIPSPDVTLDDRGTDPSATPAMGIGDPLVVPSRVRPPPP